MKSLGMDEVLLKPLITEKISVITENENRYCFKVNLQANKFQIRTAIERFYDVKVLDVKTSIMPGKVKRFGKNVKKTGKYKKALVKLSEGQKIEFFKGV